MKYAGLCFEKCEKSLGISSSLRKILYFYLLRRPPAGVAPAALVYLFSKVRLNQT